MPSVTIGFVPRERFTLASEALERLFEYTRIPFRLIVVDCNIPEVYREQMDKVLRGRKDVTILRTNRYLLPNQSRNLVLSEAKDEYLCLTENDVLVEDDWLVRLMAACEEYPADVAVPLIMEGGVHFDENLGHVRSVARADGIKLEILPRRIPKEQDPGGERRIVEFIEQHCVLFRRHVLDRIGPYDEELSTRDEVDLSLALRAAKIPILFEPRSVVRYESPWPPERADLDYFFFKWDLDHGLRGCERITRKWNLQNLPGGDAGFAKKRIRTGRLQFVKEELTGLISPDTPFILVDDNRWAETSIVEGLRSVPFLERDGQYWGLPADDATAITELERLRRAGAALIVFAWTSYWWFAHYPEFHRYVREHFPRLLEEDHITIFDLRCERVH